mgnify:CR=1 FL=1
MMVFYKPNHKCQKFSWIEPITRKALGVCLNNLFQDHKFEESFF